MFKRLLNLLIITIAGLSLSAQVTTSSITGSVRDNNGQGLAGATVTAIHNPSGTTYSTIASKDGVFNFPNVRIGGPYTVRVTFTGMQDFTIENINLELGQPFNINATLAPSSQSLEAVIVTGRSRRAAPDKVGTSTNITSRQITTLPTISRSITDFTRLTPQANGT